MKWLLSVLLSSLAACLPTWDLPGSCDQVSLLGTGSEIGAAATERKERYHDQLDDTYVACETVADCMLVTSELRCDDGSSFNFCPVYLNRDMADAYDQGLQKTGRGLCGCITETMHMASCEQVDPACVEQRCHNPYGP